MFIASGKAGETIFNADTMVRGRVGDSLVSLDRMQLKVIYLSSYTFMLLFNGAYL